MTKKTDKEIYEIADETISGGMDNVDCFVAGHRTAEAPLLAEIEQLKAKLEQIRRVSKNDFCSMEDQYGHWGDFISKPIVDKILESK